MRKLLTVILILMQEQAYDFFYALEYWIFMILNQYQFTKQQKDMNLEDLNIGRSAGKVLIAGGYGVLQQNNYGLSIALQNYFYCICTEHSHSPTSTSIIVHSPQISQHWQYISLETNENEQNGNRKISEKNNKQNVFVENAIGWTLKFFSHQADKLGTIKLLILFDRNFISNSDIQISNGMQNQRFPNYKSKYTKTGLGSSACVLVSIVKCLTKILNPNLEKQDKEKYLRTINVISQVANLSAQKKIGSNFDISTAIYGTHLYKNILPHKISQILQKMDKQKMNQLIEIDPQICTLESTSGKKMYAYIIDIKKGADTRTMVKGFMTELKKTSYAIQKQFYQSSHNIVLSLYKCFRNMIQNSNQQIDWLKKWKQINKLHRILQQKYSEITGVPIQPKDLTSLIDKLMEIEDLLYAICPGSGGYDAIFVLSLKDVEPSLSLIAKQHTVKTVSISLNSQQILSEEQIKLFNQISQKYKNL